MSLSSLIQDVCDTRQTLHEQGATPQAIQEATERLVRHYWEPLVPDERHWPAWALAPHCAYCDGTGLVLRHGVTDRLGQLVTEGTPCRCAKGTRFLPKQTGADSAHMAAGKVTKKTLTRFGG